ncbi:hypothetical protein B0T22DRAFT_538327 [Podospora appendiculata]|uniref:Uncharacterized protein n=1 Tax=Podospora appendiculata TaxID=314037 RepID=A0AAE1CB33_9PEZI|nr:hypothetical protein B0T22DRAFT_538327 [Podospora appendiculata]
MTPKVLHDELCLSALHVLELRGTPKRNLSDLNCGLFTSAEARFTRIPALESLTYADTYREVPGSCRVCLTDYTTTVERLEYRETEADQKILYDADAYAPGQRLELLRITIRSSHQIGSCRDPADWKWRTFAERRGHLSPVTREWYLESEHAPGPL